MSETLFMLQEVSFCSRSAKLHSITELQGVGFGSGNITPARKGYPRRNAVRRMYTDLSHVREQ